MIYYNEIDKNCCAWLKQLIADGHLPHGDIDDRDIRDIKPRELAPYTQCHFFAGIGGWPLALSLAGIPTDIPLWTGSCPCQPFSAAGRRGGFADERHLWPYWHHLIAQRRPAIIFGEQVASAADWLRLVRGDLEAMDYAVGAMPVEAASAGADHLRDRFWFVAHHEHAGEGRRGVQRSGKSSPAAGERTPDQFAGSGFNNGVDLAHSQRRGCEGGAEQHSGTQASIAATNCGALNSGVGLADANQPRSQGRISVRERPDQRSLGTIEPAGASAASSVANTTGQRERPDQHRANTREREFVVGAGSRGDDGDDGEGGIEWVIGADGKARRVVSDFRLLAHGLSTRMGGCGYGDICEANEKVRAYGQASSQRPAQVLHAVWQGVLSNPEPYEAVAQQAGICQAEILLAFLRQLDWSGSEGDVPFSSEEKFEAAVRSVRRATFHARTSRRWQGFEQRSQQYPDSLQALSWILAQHAQAAWAAYRSENAAPLELLVKGFPNRVGLLRGFGNAIDPRPAAVFIKASFLAIAEQRRSVRT